MDIETLNRPHLYTIRVWNDETLASTVLLSDSSGSWGIKRLDTGASVVADGTALTSLGGGQYEYDFAPPQLGIRYAVAIETTQTSGRVDREEFELWAPAPRDMFDAYIESDDELRNPALTWLNDLLDRRNGQDSWKELRREARRQIDTFVLTHAATPRRETVRDYLEKGYLIQDPHVVLAQKYWIYSELLAAQSGKPGDKFERLSRRFERQYLGELANRVWFDLDGSGERHEMVDCSSIVAGYA